MNRPRIQTAWRMRLITLDRINKRKARRLYNEGKPIFMLKANAKNNNNLRKIMNHPNAPSFDSMFEGFVKIYCNKGAYCYPAYYVED